MDSVVFVPSVASTEWLSGLFPDYSLAELPVAGRRIVDYVLEVAQKSGAMLVEVLDWHYTKRLEEYFNDPTRTGSAVFYSRAEGNLPRGLDDLAGQPSSPLTQSLSDGLVVVWGPCLALKLEECGAEEVSAADRAETPLGVYRRAGGGWERLKAPTRQVDSLRSWHRMNFEVLHDPGEFTLPGYSAESGVYLGRNVIIEHGSEVKAPVLLNDNTWFARNVRLEGDVIVGSGSFVSEGARLSRTVVGENTFIGPGLELEDKIVIGQRVIDVETGAWVDIEEPGVARRLGAVGGVLRSLWHFLRGRSYGRRG